MREDGELQVGDADGDSAWRAGDAEAVRRRFDQIGMLVTGYEGPEHRVVAANAAYRTFVGRSDVIGRPMAEIMPEAAAQQILAMVDRVRLTGQRQVGREWRIWIEHTGEESFLDIVAEPYRDASGAVVGVTGYGTDVTEQVRRRHAERDRAAAAEQRYEQAREIVTTLQREMLPSGVPVLPGVRLAASYLLAEADSQAGGDWFDAVPLPDGRVALAVGDVVGHGVRASAVMGQLRVVLEELLLRDGGDLRSVFDGMDGLAGRVRGGHAATLCVAVLDPDDGTVSYCTAGHPPPLVVGPHGPGRYLTATGSGPLATGGGFVVRTAHLAAGEVLVLYSDGIVERPGRTVQQGLAELAEVAAGAVAGDGLGTPGSTAVQRACTRTVELLVRETGHTDDVTLLAAQRSQPLPELALTEPAELVSLPRIRIALEAWLHAAGSGVTDAVYVEHAVVELATNTGQHAYADPPDPGGPEPMITVRAWITRGGEVHVEIADHGRWREPRPRPGRGMGLTLSAGLVDSVRIDHGDGGTTAAVRHRLTYPARLLTVDDIATGAAYPSPAEPDVFLVLDQPSSGLPRVRVDGPLDAQAAPRLDDELRRLTAGGTRSLVLDLTGLSMLTSGGVSVLHRATARSQDNGSHLQLFAATHSTADRVLSLVCLDHLTTDPEHVTPDHPGPDQPAR